MNGAAYRVETGMENFTDVDMLYLNACLAEGDSTVLEFVSYLKSDYISRYMKMHVDAEGVRRIYFMSNDFGTASWACDSGITEANRWENEDDLDRISFLSKNYQMPLLDGALTDSFALEKIVPDVLSHLIDPLLSKYLSGLLYDSKNDDDMDWPTLIDRNTAMAAEYLDFLAVKKPHLVSSNHNNDNPSLKQENGNYSLSADEGRSVNDQITGKRSKLFALTCRSVDRLFSKIAQALCKETNTDESGVNVKSMYNKAASFWKHKGGK